MGNKKWEKIWAAHHTTYIEAFKAGFIDHIKGKIESDNNLSNLPRNVLNRARSQKNLGVLSRIFDEFKLPVPPYEEIPKDKVGLIDHIQANLDEILPLLLNNNKDGLNQEVINAIGQDEYNQLLQLNSKTGNTQQEIASQFVGSIIISYAQRMIDHYPDKNHEIFSVISPMLADLADKVTLNGIPQEVREEAQNTIKIDGDEQARFNHLVQNINDLDKLIKRAKESGIQFDLSSAENVIMSAKSMEDSEHLPLKIRYDLAEESYNMALVQFNRSIEAQIKPGEEKLNALSKLVDEVEKEQIFIGSNIQAKIDDAKQLLQDQSQQPFDRLINAEKAYKSIINDIRNNVKNIELEKPKEINIIIKLLRFITRNERLFQQEDEKIYEEKQNLVNKVQTISQNVDENLEADKGPSLS